ncbi:shikimate dehydrogenase [Pseudoxanthobacter sp.]|uniref:shikimate dehydrogenase family protein n=1 Tax=Pseudoxanthobacter sp. TaxID=1925742 RepID=UPI002FDF446B
MTVTTASAIPATTDITGRTRLLAILADPVAHVKAPPLINRLAAERGRDAVMVPVQVAPADLPQVAETLRRLKNFDGAIVTVPHKTAMLPLCDSLSRAAELVGAVNVIRRTADGRIEGDALDGVGFVGGLQAAGIALAGRRVYLAGAGGAASAIAFALAQAGVGHLTIANRSADKARALAARVADAFPAVGAAAGDSDPSGHDLVINGTSLGMKPSDPLPLDAARLTQAMVVAEVIMEPAITPLLAAAERAGARIHRGAPMLDCQVSLMADFFGL